MQRPTHATSASTTTSAATAYIFVDGSYFCFHRVYALMQWWQKAHDGEKLERPAENPEFVAKFASTFASKLRDLPKNIGIPAGTNVVMFIGKDCKKDDIWRMSLYPGYKAGRKHDDIVGPFFAMAYGSSGVAASTEDAGAAEPGLFKTTLLRSPTPIPIAILEHPKLEADDCIAIYVKDMLDTGDTQIPIYIITSDRDYLQLNYPNVHIINMSYKDISTPSGKTTGNPDTDLRIKTLMGDKSDNIPPAFSGCGYKTALKCVENPEYLRQKLDASGRTQYELNCTLVDFNYIPQEYVDELLSQSL